MCVLVGVETSCVLCARVRGRVSRSCATENTYTPPRLEALFKLSVVAIFKHLYRSLQHLCGCTQNPSIGSTRSFLLSVVSQSSFLRKSTSNAVASVLGFHCDGIHAVLDVGGIVSVFKLQKELVGHNEGGCVPA